MTYGFAGVLVDDDGVVLTFGVGVPPLGVGDGVPEIATDGVADGLVSAGVILPFADNANFMEAISLNPWVNFTFIVLVKKPGEVTVRV